MDAKLVDRARAHIEPQLGVIRQLLKAFLRFRPTEFRFLSEGGASAWTTTGAVWLSWKLIAAAAFFLSGFYRFLEFWDTALLSVTIDLAMTIGFVLPFWILVRVFGGSPSLNFLLNVDYLCSAIIQAASSILIVFSLFISANLSNDVVATRQSNGSGTILADLVCRPIEQKAETLKAQRELNKLTHVFDLIEQSMERYGNNVPESEMSNVMAKAKANFRALPVSERIRAEELDLEIRTNILDQNAGPKVESIEYAARHYLPFVIGCAVIVAINLFSIGWIFMFTWWELAINGRPMPSRIYWTGRVLLAACVSAALGFGVYSASRGTALAGRGIVEREIASLEDSAHALSMVCGNINSHGLW